MKITLPKNKLLSPVEIATLINVFNLAEREPIFLENHSSGIIFCLSEPIKIKEQVDNRVYKMDQKLITSEISEIISYLNEKTGKRYSAKAKANIDLIRPRLMLDHYSVDDFKKIIDNKVASWIDDIKWSQYLRPETLFAKKHFESYLNEVPAHKQEEDLFSQLESYGVKGESNE